MAADMDQIIRILAWRGLAVRLDGERLEAGPRHRIDAELRHLLDRFKPELITHLGQDPTVPLAAIIETAASDALADRLGRGWDLVEAAADADRECLEDHWIALLDQYVESHRPERDQGKAA